jgi:SAM-dependent methyltransferase
MVNLFGGDSMGFGYAHARPAVHPHVVAKIRRFLHSFLPIARAVDIGCGAGLSTQPLSTVATFCIGIDPVQQMLKWSAEVAPGASFVAARAEYLPFADASVDLLAAAGSLNYADWGRFFPEAARILVPEGRLVVYDFSPGRWFRHSGDLEKWFLEFMHLYPVPPDGARLITPEILRSCDSRFRLESHEDFDVALAMSVDDYVHYMMTETNVGYAIATGIREPEIRAWCERTLEPLFGREEQEVLFRGYIAYLVKA